MYRTAVTICTAKWSLYVPHSGHYMHHKVVTICTAKLSLYVPHSGHYMHRTVVTICTAQRSLFVPQSGHYMYRTVVTLCTAHWSLYVPHSGHYTYHHFNAQQLYFLPTQIIFMFYIEQTAIISLYSINWLVFVTEAESVYCAVRTGCFFTWLAGKVQNAGFNLEANLHEIRGGKCGAELDLCSMIKVFAVFLSHLRKFLQHYKADHIQHNSLLTDHAIARHIIRAI